jgi:EmrB/QacA subfamily drug resistance transporter
MPNRTAGQHATVLPDRGSAAPSVNLGLACLGLFVIILDATIVSVALPEIARDLGFTTANLAWVVNAYTLAFAGALLLGGRLVASYGSRAVFLAGIVGFGAASLVCGVSTLPGELVAARAVQGLFGALLMPATLTVVTIAYPAGKERAHALGLWSAVGAGGGAAGTVLGGVLTDALNWRWVFLVNVPIAAIGAVGAAFVLVPARRRRVPLDLIGAVLATGGLASLVYGVLAADDHGWGSPQVTGPLAGAAVLVTAFVIYQDRWTATPLVPLSIFRSRSLSAANAVIFGLGLGFFASFVLLSVYLQDALGYSPLRAGLAFLPAAAALLIGAQTAGRLTHRFGVRAIASTGALGAVAGFAWLSRLSAHNGYWPGIALPTVLFGLGIGLAFTPITVAATAVEPHLAGIAAGVLNTTRQVSGAIGLALLTTLADSQLAPGSSPAANPGSLAPGYDLAFLVASAVALIAGIGAVTLLPGRPPGPVTLTAGSPGMSDRQPAGQRTLGRDAPRRLGLSTTTDLLLLRELTTGIDCAARTRCRLISQIVASGTTVLLTTQYLEETVQLSGQNAVISPAGSWPRAPAPSSGLTGAGGTLRGSAPVQPCAAAARRLGRRVARGQVGEHRRVRLEGGDRLRDDALPGGLA